MILEIRATDAEARKQAGYATKVAEANERDFIYRAGTFEKEVNARLDSFGMGLQYRGKQIKEVSDVLEQTRNFIIDELSKVPKPPPVVHQNVQVQTDFAAQFATQLNHNDHELANLAQSSRQLAHRLHLVEGQQNALALGVPTAGGVLLQTNVTSAQQDIRQLRLDFNKLEKQFIEMRSAIDEVLLTKPPAVKESELVNSRILGLEQRIQAHALLRAQDRGSYEARIKDLEVRMGNAWDELERKSDKRKRTPKK